MRLVDLMIKNNKFDRDIQSSNMKENFFPECLSKDYANALRRIRETIALKSTLVTKPKDNFVSESIEMKRVSKNER